MSTTKSYGWRPDTPDPINDRPLGQRAHSTALPDQIWLDPTALPLVRDQGDQGACTGFGVTGALMWSLAAKQGRTVQLSPAFAYLQGRLIEGAPTQDTGCEIRSTVKGVAKNGCSLEQYMPYDPKKLPVRAGKRAAASALAHQIKVGYYRCADRSVDDLLQALAANLPVVGGYSWYGSLDGADFEASGVMPIPKKGERLIGGHCSWLCGADVPARMLFWQNSFGPKYAAHPKTGARGYVLMPFEWVERGLADDFWAIDHE
jgi:hypothetical protein